MWAACLSLSTGVLRKALLPILNKLCGWEKKHPQPSSSCSLNRSLSHSLRNSQSSRHSQFLRLPPNRSQYLYKIRLRQQ